MKACAASYDLAGKGVPSVARFATCYGCGQMVNVYRMNERSKLRLTAHYLPEPEQTSEASAPTLSESEWISDAL